MRNVIKFVQHHIVGDLLMIAILIAGLVGLNMKSNFFPVVKSKFITIQVAYPGAAPEEIETGVVAKIEENLQGLADIDIVTSTVLKTQRQLEAIIGSTRLMRYFKT